MLLDFIRVDEIPVRTDKASVSYHQTMMGGKVFLS